jgi:hypothetical protein
MRKSSVVALGLTGRTRYRTHSRFLVGVPVLVLQVEEEVADQLDDGDHGPISRAWRDAQVQDLAELELSASV